MVDPTKLKQADKTRLKMSLGSTSFNQLFPKQSALTRLSNLLDVPSPLHFAIIELLSTELAYSEELAYLNDVYFRLLAKCSDYESILIQREKELLFQNVHQLQIISGDFLRCFVEFLRKSSGLHGAADSKQELVLSSDLNKINLGSLISKELCDNKKYQTHILSFIVTQPFRLKFLDHKRKYGGELFARWLQESEIYSKQVGKNSLLSIESLLDKPIQRLSKYPLLLKKILDEGRQIWSPIQQHELSVCLIKFNLLLHECNVPVPIDTWIECEKMISEVEVQSTVSHEDVVSEFRVLVDMLSNLFRASKQVCSSILEFSKENCKYASMWSDIFNCPESASPCMGIPYESYCSKNELQLKISIKFVAEELEGCILARLKLAMDMCEEAKSKLGQRQKLKKSYMMYVQRKEGCSRSAQKYILLDNRIKEQLPKLKICIEELCVGTEVAIGRALRRWMESYFGTSALSKYRDAGEIMQQYKSTVQMSGMKAG